MRYQFDYGKLKGKYIEVLGSQEAYAKAIDIDRTSLNKRLTNQLPFKSSEILASVNVLNIEKKDIPEYFFTLKVEKTQHIQKDIG